MKGRRVHKLKFAVLRSFRFLLIDWHTAQCHIVKMSLPFFELRLCPVLFCALFDFRITSILKCEKMNESRGGELLSHKFVRNSSFIVCEVNLCRIQIEHTAECMWKSVHNLRMLEWINTSWVHLSPFERFSTPSVDFRWFFLCLSSLNQLRIIINCGARKGLFTAYYHIRCGRYRRLYYNVWFRIAE